MIVEPNPEGNVQVELNNGVSNLTVEAPNNTTYRIVAWVDPGGESVVTTIEVEDP